MENTPQWVGRIAIETVLARYFKKFIVGQPDDCWIWEGAKEVGGYGFVFLRFGTKRVKARASHLAMYVRHGKWPPVNKPNICHTCDVPSCVNPDHLYFGTQADNIRDIYARNRDNTPRGSASGCSKITENTVREIRALYFSDVQNGRGNTKLTLKVIAKRYGIGFSQVSRIIKRHNWKHVA